MTKNVMHVHKRNFFHRIDTHFITVILALNIIGLINLYSATHGVSLTSLAQPFSKQIIWLTAGWILFFGLTVTDYKIFRRIGILLYFINLSALVAVLIKGHTALGAQRWLELGFFRYQPSETMKLACVFVLARVLSKINSIDGLGYRNLIKPLLIVACPFALTVKQPDLGTALLLVFVSASMVLFVKVKRSIMVIAATACLIATPLMWNFGLKNYQKNRILTFLRPGHDPRGTGYNSIQSKIAVGSGQILGKGFKKGTQSQLEFIPERHTDFIFSVLSEETGFIGSITTIGLFVILFLMGLRISQRAKDKFGALLVVGLLSLVFWHMFINICMVIGLMPIVGVPLPLLSYGGSSLLTVMIALGLISSVAYRRYLF